MMRDQILSVLKAHRGELEARGVTHAALFGSMARNEGGANSDIDILVEIDPAAPIGVWGYSEVILFLQGLFEQAVDVVQKEALCPHVRPGAERDAVYAF